MNPRNEVWAQVKDGCHHMSSKLTGGDVFLADRAELEAFADKLDALPALSERHVLLLEHRSLALTEQEIARLEEEHLEVVQLLNVDSEKSKSEIDATASAVELAEKYGIRLEEVPGTGRDGRIVKNDVLQYYGRLNMEEELGG